MSTRLERRFRSTLAVHVLRSNLALEDIPEVCRQRAVDVEEVRHIDDVVDDLAKFVCTTC